MEARISRYDLCEYCYPRYQYMKTYAANIKKDYVKLRLSHSTDLKPSIDEDTQTGITLYVVEPFTSKLFLSSAEFVLRAPEKCRTHVINLGKEVFRLYRPNFADRTVVAMETFGIEKDESLTTLLLLAEDKDDLAVLENYGSSDIQICLKENVNVKICEMLERDVLLQMEKVYKDVDKVRCDIEKQLKTGNHQETVSRPCSCSTDKGSCNCYGSIIEDIKRLQADITGLIKRSKVPEDQKPQLNTDTEMEVDRKVIDALKKTSPSIDHCGYNLDTLYIFVDEEYPSEMLKANVGETMEELFIENFRIVSSHVDEYSNPASGSGVVVKTKKGEETISLSGTLSGFGRLEKNKSLVAIMSRHLAIYSMDKKLYIPHGLNCVTGDIMKELFQSPEAVRTTLRDENGDSDTATEPAGASIEDQTQSVIYPKIYMDIAFAYIDKEDEHVCDTMYRTDKKERVAGRLCAFDPGQMYRLPVYIWGHATGLGRGIISMPNIVPVNDSDKHLLMIEDTKGNTFCKEGDSGAMVCADDPENYGEKVQLISIVMGAVLGEDGKYKTLKIKEGLDHLAAEVGENVNIC